MPEVRPEYLEGKKVGAVAGSSHEAYLKAMFTDAELHSYPNDDALRQALRRGEVDFIFGDAISLAFWINGTDSGECCAFSGGPFVESRYFGEGVGIAVRKGNDLLRQALNWALFRVWEKGRYTDLWLRYFSVSPFQKSASRHVWTAPFRQGLFWYFGKRIGERSCIRPRDAAIDRGP